MRQLAGLVALVTTTASAAHADDVLYVEALGKAGAYGVGYEHAMNDRFSLGIAGSFVSVSGQQVYTAAPYLHMTVVGSKRHALFTELGGVLAHSRIPSPVDDWDGMTDTGGGGFWSAGYEYRRGAFLVRTSAAIVVGEGGAAPMIGIAFGVKP